MRLTWTIALMIPLVAITLQAADNPQQGPQDIDIQQIMTSVIGGPAAAGTAAGALPDFKEVTKDMKSDSGLFTLWHYPAEVKDKDQEKLLCQIPAGFLGQKFMLSTSIAGGGFFTGFPWEERVVQWELLDRQLLLIEPETRFVVDQSKEVSDAVRRTYPDRIRVAVPVVTKSPQGDPVIDLGALLKSNFADVSFLSFDPMTGAFGGGGVNPALSKWTKKKVFELNVEIGVELAMSRLSPSGSYDKKLVHFSFWKLPTSDYAPRVADDRIGYFLTANQDWAKPGNARDIFNRYIDRWHLVKRDPSLKLCEPRQPIIFYIEKTVPVKYRRAVRDGILEWNEAYEKVGFVNAVEVRQQTADNEWKDLDPEDMRYSFFRWIVTGAGFAMGPHRANPFTGQIYDADIIFDDSMVRYFEQEMDQMLLEDALAYKMSDPALQGFLKKNDEWKRTLPGHFALLGDKPDDHAPRQMVLDRLRKRGLHGCDYLQGMRHQMALAGTVLAEQPQEVKDRFLYDVIKEVVMHEVGHTLGLRHNFKASSIYSLDEIKQRSRAGQATVGSVMDYNPVLFFADSHKQGNFLTATIGPYDYWAIEYGYRPADGSYAEAAKADGPSKPTEQQQAKPKVAAQQGAVHSTQIKISDMNQAVKDIPPEVLAQLPPELKKALESGNVQALMAGASGPAVMTGAKPQPSAPGPQAPSFKAPPSGEQKMLQAIASRAAEPDLVYATDEDTTFFGIDPLSNRFDMGADPLAWAEQRMNLVNKRMGNILEWAVKEQESWYYLRQAFARLLFEKAVVLDYVGRFIGGQYFNRSHRGDTDAATPFVLVAAKQQRRALQFIDKHLFQDDFFQFSPEVLNHLAPSRWYHSGSYPSYALDFPIHDIISLFQWWNLFDRLFPDTLRRIHDAEMKSSDPDKFTVAEYLQTLQKSCWASSCDLSRAKNRSWSDSKPFISDIQRSLQREYLGLMEPLVRYRPGRVLSPDLHAMVMHSLANLSTQITAVSESGPLDFASQAHLAACKSRIDRMLTAELNEFGQ